MTNPSAPDMVIVGYAVVLAELIEPRTRAQFAELGPPKGGRYGALFIYELDGNGQRKPWTLITADGEYARLLTTEAGRVEMSAEVLRAKFPAFVEGWQLPQ